MSMKIVCVAAVLAGSLIASQALAECSKAEEVSLAKVATKAVSERISGRQGHKVMRIYECDATNGVLAADFRYDYVTADGVQTVTGSVKADNSGVTALDMAAQTASVAWNDSDYTETTLGTYNF
ncbi:MAG: hypothetical protein JF615_14800 [Asticcacaulis sp.]|nr:hypothetical protein [Asticcacaulis sp.]